MVVGTQQQQQLSSTLVLRGVEAVPARAAVLCRVGVRPGTRWTCQFEAPGHGLLTRLDNAHLIVLAAGAALCCGAAFVPARRASLLFLCADAEDLELVVVAGPGQHELLVVHAVVDVVLVYKGRARLVLGPALGGRALTATSLVHLLVRRYHALVDHQRVI